MGDRGSKGKKETKLPAIVPAQRVKPKDTDRVKVADNVVREWLDEKTKGYSLSNIPRLDSHHLCRKDGGTRLEQIRATSVPYLQRHMKVDQPFPEKTLYGKFKQLE